MKIIGRRHKIEFAQTNVSGISQVFTTTTPTKITGTSTFLSDGDFDNDGGNTLKIRYIGSGAKVEFHWCVVTEPNQASDGNQDVRLAVAGTSVAATKTTAGVDAAHGGTASGCWIRVCTNNEVFTLNGFRTSGGGNTKVTDVIFTAKILQP